VNRTVALMWMNLWCFDIFEHVSMGSVTFERTLKRTSTLVCCV